MSNKVVTRIEFESVFGIPGKLVIEPGPLTLIGGENAEGKTSIKKGIVSLLNTKAELQLHKGMKAGSAEMFLDDKTKISRKISIEKQTKGKADKGITISDPEVGSVGAVATYLDRLVHETAYDVLMPITCEDSELADIIIAAMPMPITEATKAEIEAYIHMPIVVMPEGKHIMIALSKLYDQFYKERTGYNQTVTLHKKTIQNLTDSLPDQSDLKDWEPEITALEEEKAKLTKEKAADIKAADDALAAANISINEGYGAQIRKADTTRNEAIAAAQAVFDAAKDAANDAFDARKKDLDEKKPIRSDAAKKTADDAKAASAARIDPEVTRITTEIAVNRLKNESFIKCQGTLDTIENSKTELATADNFSGMRTVALEGIEKMRLKLTEKMKIEGLQINTGQVSVDGVNFQELNLAKQIDICFTLAELSGKQLNLIICDNLEAFSFKSLRILEKKLQDSGFQAIGTYRTDGPLTIFDSVDALETAQLGYLKEREALTAATV